MPSVQQKKGRSARVETLEVTLDDRGSSGVGSSRDASADWVDALVKRRAGPAPTMRLEWQGERGDLAGPATVSEPPEWVDCMTTTADGSAVRLRLVRGDGEGGPTVQRVEVVALGGALTRRYLRGVGLGQVVAEVDRVLADWGVARHLGEAWRLDVRRPGRAGRPDADYARWAKRYVDALAVAPRSPVKHIVDEALARGEHCTEKEVKAKVGRARERQLLTRSPQGRAGGELTEKALVELRRIGEV